MSGAHVPGGPGRADGPRVVAVGGGHGLAATLRAVRGYAGAVTAVVSVADDGGSTGRLRAAGDRPAPGDLRKCLVALAGGDSPLLRAMEYRFDAGELDGHAFGNLLIAALEDSEGDLVSALDEVGRILGAVGRVLPATTHPVQLRAVVGSGAEVRGQVAVARQPDLELVTVDPPDAPVCAPALEAILAADQVVLGPGSLYTSVLAATAVPGIAEGLAATSARLVYVCNLRPPATGWRSTSRRSIGTGSDHRSWSTTRRPSASPTGRLVSNCARPCCASPAVGPTEPNGSVRCWPDWRARRIGERRRVRARMEPLRAVVSPDQHRRGVT
jgi:uncharacterized cofD-like protein